MESTKMPEIKHTHCYAPQLTSKTVKKKQVSSGQTGPARIINPK